MRNRYRVALLSAACIAALAGTARAAGPEQFLSGNDFAIAIDATPNFFIDTYDADFQHSLALGERHQLVWGGGARLVHYKIGSIPFYFDPSGRGRVLDSVVDEVRDGGSQLVGFAEHDSVGLAVEGLGVRERAVGSGHAHTRLVDAFADELSEVDGRAVGAAEGLRMTRG